MHHGWLLLFRSICIQFGEASLLFANNDATSMCFVIMLGRSMDFTSVESRRWKQSTATIVLVAFLMEWWWCANRKYNVKRALLYVVLINKQLNAKSLVCAECMELSTTYYNKLVSSFRRNILAEWITGKG